MTIYLNDWEKAMVVLALRNLALTEIQKAISLYEHNKVIEGNEAKRKSDDARNLAAKIESTI